MSVFDLSEIQANYILEMPLRRLTKFSRIELESERDDLNRTLAELDRLLNDPDALRDLVSTELAEVAAAHATPRRTVLLEGPAPLRGAAATAAPLELSDDPCEVLLSSTGLIARTGPAGGRGSPGVAPARVPGGPTTWSWPVPVPPCVGDVGVVTSAGRVVRAHVQDLPSLPGTAGPVSLAGGAPAGGVPDPRARRVRRRPGEPDPGAPTLAVATASGVIKRVADEPAPNRDAWEIIRLADRDVVIGALPVADDDEFVLLADDAQLLRFPASAVARRAGRPAAWPGSSSPVVRRSSPSASGHRAAPESS